MDTILEMMEYGGNMKRNIKLSFLYSQIVFFILLPVWIELTKYLHPIVIGVVWFSIYFLVLFGVLWVKKGKIQLSEHILHVFTFLYSIGLLILLFFRPKGQSYESINLIPFDTIYFYLSGNVNYLIALYNLGANIGLFIPFGLYYRYIKKTPSMKQMLIITIYSISTIEGLQFITKRGTLDIDDLMLNVLGVYLGYFIYPFFQKVLVMK
ncbi:VanZ family protein [Metabacillus sediminilitoris]|uniref:VanZ family protein n=2 Tax=Metabacillus sediminilitoris TaxID=2567941 RepID=A0A4S4C9P9_9BACI|nr:VanZ family protein [Metabacillus sediminilitoris]THF82546.1 VanZ family protein [Metabacillus sediminilitoris]